MIARNSTVILRTIGAIYSTCKVLEINESSVTISFSAGTKRDRETGEYVQNIKEETIPRKKIIQLSERP